MNFCTHGVERARACSECAKRRLGQWPVWQWVVPSVRPGLPKAAREKLFCKFCGGRLMPDPSFPAHAQMYDEYTGERINPPKVCLNAQCNRGITF